MRDMLRLKRRVVGLAGAMPIGMPCASTAVERLTPPFPYPPGFMSKDHERLSETSEAFIYVAMSRLIVKRLARS
jgi:hypothetical protein